MTGLNWSCQSRRSRMLVQASVDRALQQLDELTVVADRQRSLSPQKALQSGCSPCELHTDSAGSEALKGVEERQRCLTLRETRVQEEEAMLQRRLDKLLLDQRGTRFCLTSML